VARRSAANGSGRLGAINVKLKAMIEHQAKLEAMTKRIEWREPGRLRK
jgi:hypothetical protein